MRAIHAAAKPVTVIDNSRPKISTGGWARAAPATPRTLSRERERSATRIWKSAVAMDLGLAGAAAAPLALASAAAWRPARRSRHIRQPIHSNRAPPAASRPTILSSWTAIRAKPISMTTSAPASPRVMARRCWSGGRPWVAMATATALSPAMVRSIITTWTKAVIHPPQWSQSSVIAGGRGVPMGRRRPATPHRGQRRRRRRR